MNEFPSLEEIDATRAERSAEHEAEAKHEEQLHVENGRVRVVAEDGQAGTVPVAKLEGFLARGGRIESHQERAERIGGGAGKAFGTGLAVGALDAAMAPTKFAGAAYGYLTGNQDPFADVSGRAVLEGLGQTREQLEAREEAHGGAFKAGEFGGLGVVGAGLAPLVNPAGAAAGRVLGAGAELGGVGAHAAHTVAHIGGEVAAGVLEGAMMGASGASEEAWLKNEKLTSEHAMHSIMEFALWGGAAMAGFKALGAGASKLSKFIKRGGEEAAHEAAPALETAAARAEGVLGETADAAQPGLLDQPEKLGLWGRAQRRASRWGNEAAVKTVFRADLPAARKAGLIGGGEENIQKLGQILNDAGVIGGSDSSMLERVREIAQREGPKLDKIVTAVDQDHGRLALALRSTTEEGGWIERVKRIADNLREEAVHPEDFTTADWIERQTSILRQKADDGVLGYMDLRNFRKKVDAKLKFDPQKILTSVDQAKMALRSITEDEVEKGVKAFAEARGEPAVLSEYMKAKELYGAMMKAMTPLEKRVEGKNFTNLTLGLTGNVLGSGSIVATALGHPEALAIPLAGKVLKERGWSTAAVLAKKIAGEAIDVSAAPASAQGQARALKTFVAVGEEKIRRSITGFLSHYEEQAIGGAVKTALSKVPKETLAERLKLASGDLAREHYADHAAHVAEVTGSPDVAEARVSAALGHGLGMAAPKLYGAMAAQAGSVAQFLKSKLPMPGVDPNNLTPNVKRMPPVSDAALAQYRESYEGATDPLSVLDDMHTGRVSSEKIEAVKTLWPAVYASIQRTVFAELADMKEPLPYDKALLLDRMFDAKGAIAGDMKPESLAAMQEAASYVMQQQQARHPSPSTANPMGKSMQPRSEALAMR